MFTVYSGSGAKDYNVGGPSFTTEQSSAFRRATTQLLRSRGYASAAKLLDSLPFELREGNNFFGDEFVVLYAEVPISQYVELVNRYSDSMERHEFRQIASAMNEICPIHVRFIGFGATIEEAIPPIDEPRLRLTNRTVEDALADARQLIAARGSTSGVDRAHTAFHGYLRALCEDAQISVPLDAEVTVLFRALREQHPALQEGGARSEDITRTLRALSTIVDALNPLRNKATLVHPNPELLEEAEADLVLNSIHTLLHYLNKKLT